MFGECILGEINNKKPIECNLCTLETPLALAPFKKEVVRSLLDLNIGFGATIF